MDRNSKLNGMHINAKEFLGEEIFNQIYGNVNNQNTQRPPNINLQVETPNENIVIRNVELPENVQPVSNDEEEEEEDDDVIMPQENDTRIHVEVEIEKKEENEVENEEIEDEKSNQTPKSFLSLDADTDSSNDQYFNYDDGNEFFESN